MDNFFCSFCGIKIYPGHGSLFVKNNLKLHYFCRSKCRKLFHLKKNPLFFPWTIFNRINRGLDLENLEKKKIFNIKKTRTTLTYNDQIVHRIVYELKRSELDKTKKQSDYIFEKKKKKIKVV